jgi:hypothetical protein
MVTRCLGDQPIEAARFIEDIVDVELELARSAHLSRFGCATNGHDPGDEDPGEGVARRDWAVAP